MAKSLLFIPAAALVFASAVAMAPPEQTTLACKPAHMHGPPPGDGSGGPPPPP